MHRRVRQAGWGSALVGLLLTGVVATASPASADVVSKFGRPYVTGNDCTGVRAEISHGNWDRGYFKTDTNSEWNLLQANCMGSLSRPVGYISAQIAVWKYVNGQWTTCTTLPKVYNNTSTNKLVTSRHYALTPCGTGSYRAVAFGYVYNHGSWNGGRVVTDSYHNLYD